MSSTIAVVDYGMGNLRSVSKALEHVVSADQRVIVTSDAAVIADAERIVFPGQGAARDCMKHLKEMQLEEVVLRAANEKPFLGICMGMQVLMAHSEENQGIKCMGLYAGEVRAFADEALASQMQSLKIPHMGWNKVSQKQTHPLWHDIHDGSRFYFVHSYYVDPADEALVAGTTDYGIDFVSVIARDNVFAAQFHPEKSAHDGLQLLNNFCRWNGRL
ncbi:MAG: imidazole glycerol phosphate synthase subunit HisH [Gammaproteobacteria bacterium]|nr:imidazole glycerol phosphate synthase subunit HisH [Gammaproteobacteria bacterium]NNJ50566.1 imidazole glycerol phosphate synthase subunit HisH [Gammaproteobacteria bacterium]